VHLAVRLPIDNIEQSSLFREIKQKFMQNAKMHLKFDLYTLLYTEILKRFDIQRKDLSTKL
jgi:hypothetical protein